MFGIDELSTTVNVLSTNVIDKFICVGIYRRMYVYMLCTVYVPVLNLCDLIAQDMSNWSDLK